MNQGCKSNGKILFFGFFIIGFMTLSLLPLGYGLYNLVFPEKAIADLVTASATAGNALPIAGEPYSFSIPTLNEGAPTTVICSATISDDNGCSEVTGATAAFFRSDLGAGSSCTPDSQNCYILTSEDCDLDTVIDPCTPGGSDLTVIVECSTDVEFYVDATDAGPHEGTDWTCEILPSDAEGPGDVGTVTTDMPSNNALAADPTEIAYGIVYLGQINNAPVNISVQNTGNRSIDVELSGVNMTCPAGGTIPVENQKYSDDEFFDYEIGGSILYMTGGTLVLDLPPPSDSQQLVEAETYWQIKLPETGISGLCTGGNTFLAVTDDD
ncbi:hypothetical protein KKC32_01085 [Patescibacteria group bacterium]|nr:hypothetical protein [Patescibacteria group bacterium]